MLVYFTGSDGNAKAPGHIGIVVDFDPATGTWTLTGSMSTVRFTHTATMLPGNTVLAAGGVNGSGTLLTSAEIFDPATGTWTLTGAMGTARANHAATLMTAQGTVLVTGGGTTSSLITNSAEVFDPATGTWSGTGSMAGSRIYHTSTLLPDGTVLVAGGDAPAVVGRRS